MVRLKDFIGHFQLKQFYASVKPPKETRRVREDAGGQSEGFSQKRELHSSVLFHTVAIQLTFSGRSGAELLNSRAIH